MTFNNTHLWWLILAHFLLNDTLHYKLSITLGNKFNRFSYILFDKLKAHRPISKKLLLRKLMFFWYCMPIFSFIKLKFQIYKQTSLTFYTSKDMSLKRVEKKKISGRHNRDISLKICRGSHLCEMAV